MSAALPRTSFSPLLVPRANNRWCPRFVVRRRARAYDSREGSRITTGAAYVMWIGRAARDSRWDVYQILEIRRRESANAWLSEKNLCLDWCLDLCLELCQKWKWDTYRLHLNRISHFTKFLIFYYFLLHKICPDLLTVLSQRWWLNLFSATKNPLCIHWHDFQTFKLWQH